MRAQSILGSGLRYAAFIFCAALSLPALWRRISNCCLAPTLNAGSSQYQRPIRLPWAAQGNGAASVGKPKTLHAHFVQPRYISWNFKGDSARHRDCLPTCHCSRTLGALGARELDLLALLKQLQAGCFYRLLTSLGGEPSANTCGACRAVATFHCWKFLFPRS